MFSLSVSLRVYLIYSTASKYGSKAVVNYKGLIFNLRMLYFLIVVKRWLSKGMNNKYKLAVLSFLLVISLIPITVFFVIDYPRAEVFIRGLLTGQAGISINVSKDWFDIYSTVFFGSIRFSLTYVVMLLSAKVVFIASLALISKNLYSRHKLTKQRVDQTNL